MKGSARERIGCTERSPSLGASVGVGWVTLDADAGQDVARQLFVLGTDEHSDARYEIERGVPCGPGADGCGDPVSRQSHLEKLGLRGRVLRCDDDGVLLLLVRAHGPIMPDERGLISIRLTVSGPARILPS